jgi:hypothetical protein
MGWLTQALPGPPLQEGALEETFSKLSHLTALTHLELPLSATDLFGETPQRPASSLAVFARFTHLRSLSLAGQELVPVDALASLLEPLTNLTSLDLSGIRCLSVEFSVLCSSLKAVACSPPSRLPLD